MGQRAARRYFITAETLDAETARALGLLSEVVGVDDLDSAVESLVATLLANGPCAVREAKRLVLDYGARPIEQELIADSCQRIADIRASEEGQAGLAAFLDKSDPPWRSGRV
jgi:methylglutaconyl-CoA hydratase